MAHLALLSLAQVPAAAAATTRTQSVVSWAGILALSEPPPGGIPHPVRYMLWDKSNFLRSCGLPQRHAYYVHTASISDRASDDPWGHEPCPANVHHTYGATATLFQIPHSTCSPPWVRFLALLNLIFESPARSWLCGPWLQ
ncbi:uncharacterized protein LY79DRAFT_541609 [Colletotrichum navitas]|uniref:Uncharacterized protein n=1 Tax=Colletotrichum navitas TaxID=681940 RepID=A0AAD8QAG9_9PEZI|nr:uncharacterized protein LY79DRAFT_541609 [Colletotrichum navitas]KAK1597434.1 hypothetical protein LY79DRAFT_541609 [Colletotrichum navitas]